MGGIGLGRLWDTHPRIAFVLHSLLTLYFGAISLLLFVQGATGGGIALGIGFALMAASLVTLTWLEAQNGWRSNGDSYDGRGRVVDPRTAWANTQAGGRLFWMLFAIAFLSAWVLMLFARPAGVALILAAFVLAIIAMRAD